LKAIRIHSTGGPEVLRYEEAPDPGAPGPGQVLVELRAIGVNFADTYARSGLNPPPRLPWTPGGEGAGTVRAVGQGVAEVAVGDMVAYTGAPGSYAEQVIAPAHRLVKLPRGTTPETGAAALLQGMTAHYLCHATYRLRPGVKTLIHAGAGGVGLLLIQMAKRLGAYVFTTVSTEEKAQIAREAGADHVILYTRQDFAEEIKRSTNGEGVEVVYDSVGKDTFEKSLTCLIRRGYLVYYGWSSGPVPPVSPAVLSTRSLFLTRPTLGDYTATRQELLKRAGDVLRWIRSGDLKVRIHKTYHLSQAAEAHRDLQGRETSGKLLLTP